MRQRFRFSTDVNVSWKKKVSDSFVSDSQSRIPDDDTSQFLREIENVNFPQQTGFFNFFSPRHERLIDIIIVDDVLWNDEYLL